MPKLLFSRTALSTWISGVMATALGLLVLWGWLFKRVDLIQIQPEGLTMVVNTALCFTLGGLSLLLVPLRKHKSVNILQSVLLIGLVLLSAAELTEILFGLDLGIDQAERHRLLQPGLNYPGRMSPNSALGFLLFGVAVLLHIHAGRSWLKGLMRWLTLLVFLLGLFGLTGYLLDLANLYPDFFRAMGISGMALPTAVGLIALGLGLWGLWYHDYMQESAGDHADEGRIRHTILFVIAAVGLATGVAGFAFLQSALKSENELGLSRLQAERSTLFETVLEHRMQRAIVASRQLTVFNAIKTLYSKPDDPASLAVLRHVGESLLQNGFVNVAVSVRENKQDLAGRPYQDQAFTIALENSDGALLSWHDGYFLRFRQEIKDPVTGTLYGSFLTEQSLERLDHSAADIQHWGQTGEMVVCAMPTSSALKCFPSRSSATPTDGLRTTYRGQLLPMVYALRKETGVKTTEDYRGHRVIAGHGPIGKTGLGLVAKMDLVEIYAPIRQRLQLAIPAILALVLLGMLMIRARIKPMLVKQNAIRARVEQERSNFIAAAESNPDAFFILESCKDDHNRIVDFRFSYLNHNVPRIFPLVQQDLTGLSLLEKFPYRLNFFEKYKKVAETGVILDEEFSWRFRDQPSMWVNLQVAPIAAGVTVTWRDMTGKRNSERLLEQSNRLREAIVDSAAYAIIATEVDGTIMSFNQAAERLLGYHARELVKLKTPGIFHDPEEVVARAESLSEELGCKIEPGFEVFVAKAKLGFDEEHEWTYIRKDGSRVAVRLAVTALRDAEDKITGYLGVAHDVSEQKRMTEYMRHVASHDVLTGLPNRALLDQRMQMAMATSKRTGRPFALALLDIDRFKQINDTLGHHVGDQVLIEFVERVKSCVLPTDTFARMGGDEFVMVFPGCDAETVAVILKRVLEVLLPPMQFEGPAIQVTSSIGISIFPDHGEDQATLMRQADQAMYVVKQQGRNGYKVFVPESVIELSA